MTPRKLNLFIANFAYGGNGGCANEHPDVREWFCQTMMMAKEDPRIGDINTQTFSDTPITLTRNKAVLVARQLGADLILFCDSDQSPNLHAREQGFEPFFKSSFDYLYAHYEKGPVCIGAPYCGPPPHENVYVFRWDSTGVYGDETSFSLEQYSRHEASRMQGIQECAALPTGLIMFDMRMFDLIEPSKMSQRQVLEEVEGHRMSIAEAMRNISNGWFYYEWKNQYAAEKASTEDVTATRDMAMVGQEKLGYNPVLCNWNSPIGHWKPWCVPGRPRFFGNESVGGSFRRAMERDASEHDRIIDVQLPDRFKSLPVNHVAPARNGHVVKVNGRPVYLAEGIQTPPSHLEALRELVRAEHVRRDNGALTAVEVGSWHGDSAKAMVAGGAQVTCVDHWQGTPGDPSSDDAKLHDPWKEFLKNTTQERNDRWIKVRKASSLDAARDFADGSLDIIHIDAEHTYEALKADIAAWWPKLHPHGVMVGHDYKVHQFPGVTEAVEECFEGHAIDKLGFDKVGWGYWLVYKANTAYSPQEKTCV